MIRDGGEILQLLNAAKDTLAGEHIADPRVIAETPGGRKRDVVVAIAQAVGHRPPPMSRGSTEPREIFVLVDRTLGLRLHEEGLSSKHDLARGIVDAAAIEVWLPDYTSAGGTVTLSGLKAVLRAVLHMLRP